MKWGSHQIITTTAVLAATGSPTMAILAGGFSPIPDKIDHLCGVFGRMPIRMFNHREHSHYWGYWFLIAIFSLSYMKTNHMLLTQASDIIALGKMVIRGYGGMAWDIILPNIGFWMSVGCLFHIFEDFFSGMGVPLVVPNKISPHIKIYTTGGISEYLVTFFVAGSLLVFQFLGPQDVRFAVQKAINSFLFG